MFGGHVDACMISYPLPSACPKCGPSKDGLSCCGKGGSWREKCGAPGDTRSQYTWSEGVRACLGVSATINLNDQSMPSSDDSTTGMTGSSIASFIIAKIGTFW